MDRIARIGHQDHVARRRDRLRDIGEAFLRAERGDDLGVRVELHVEAAGVVSRLRAAQSQIPREARIRSVRGLPIVSLSFSMIKKTNWAKQQAIAPVLFVSRS